MTTLTAHKKVENAVASEPRTDIADIENIYVISDLHTDNVANLEWLIHRCSNHKVKNTPGRNDCLIIVGDISHELSKIEETLSIILEGLGCHVFFVWGNHEAWIGGKEMDALGISTSLQKIKQVQDLCCRLGVRTNLELVGNNHKNPVFILPIESWYDATLSLEGCEDLCSTFNDWPWVDFLRCKWPTEVEITNLCLPHEKMHSTFRNYHVTNSGRIPKGLAKWFAIQNLKAISQLQAFYETLLSSENMSPTFVNQTFSDRLPDIISFSHFLPNQQTLPDWKDLDSKSFRRHEWLDHPVPEVSAKFAKVAGSLLIDDQIRSIIPQKLQNSKVKHLHIFGHSHRPKDFVFNGIRYIHNPLGKPKERQMKMVSDDVDFQLIWNCTMSERDESVDAYSDDVSFTGGIGEIPGVKVLRFWEEQGGGKELFAARFGTNRK